MAQTEAQKKASATYRKRLGNRGLKRKTLWLRPEWMPAIRKFILELKKGVKNEK